MQKFLPVFLVELYLIGTLLLLKFGPVEFNLHNESLFFFLMLSYHLSFVLGYCLSTASYKFNGRKIDFVLTDKFFYMVFSLAVLSVLLSYKNLMLASSVIPLNIFQDVMSGISEPGLVYAERMNKLSSSAGGESRWLNILSLLFAFFKLLFVFVFLYFWSSLSFFKKCLAIFYCLLFCSPGLASGTNSVIFLFFIYFISSILVILYIRKHKFLRGILCVSAALFLIPVGMFGFIMSKRGGGFEYFSTTSPLGDIDVALQTPELGGVLDFYSYSMVWLNYYLVQGYYGFSLILDMGLNWTYGFGSSAFLQRQLLVLTGIDVSDQTFQARISEYWDKDVQWHSFYGQLANDFGFIGVAGLMFFLGYYFSRIWLSAVYNDSFYAAALIPMFILMMVFFPANNQVFGYIDTLSYFVVVSFFWLFEGKKIRC